MPTSLSRKLVQVAGPTQENTLAQGMVVTARSIRDMGDDLPIASIPDLYLLEPEGFEDQEKVAGLLFTGKRWNRCRDSSEAYSMRPPRHCLAASRQ